MLFLCFCMPPPSSLFMSQGWMNEIHSYDPEMYHATLTHSVYVRLEGSVLRLSKPNRNISRRAAHNEPKPDVTFVSQKIYDLTDSKVRPPRTCLLTGAASAGEMEAEDGGC